MNHEALEPEKEQPEVQSDPRGRGVEKIGLQT